MQLQRLIMIGKTFSHYEILEKLGEGGMGVVYKAHDTKLDRMVALKFLPPHLAGSDSDKARFLQEARAAAALNHPNVCVIYEIEDSGEHPYIAMELIDGVTLRDELAEGALEVNAAVDYAIQIAEALKAAHAREVIHRDIKSDNIMITADRRIKVTDFGLAKLRGAAKLTRTSSTMGTLAYMPPEHIQGKEVDARADIFSFGVVLYEMLTGQLPFRGEYDSAMIYSILNEEPEPLEKYRAGLSSELVHVVNRALEKDPDERYQSVSDMLIDLKRLKRDTGRISRESPAYRAAVEKRRASSPSRKWKRSYWIGGSAAAAVIIIALWFVGRTFFHSGPGDSALRENSVAVMYFENRSGEENLGKILADMLISNLSRCEEIDVVSSQHLFDILKRMGMEDVKAIDRSVATDVAAKAGVQSMLLGSVYRVGSTLHVNAQLCDVKSGRVTGAALARGSRVEDVYEMVNTLTREVIELMGVSRDAGGEELRINDITTNSFEAYRHYQRGWEHVNRFNWSEAVKEFEEAVRIDSTFAMGHCWEAFIKGIFKFDPHTDLTPQRESMRLAKKYSQKATEQEREFIESIDYFISRDYDRFIEKTKELADNYPNNSLAHSILGTGYYMLGNWKMAIQVWERVLAIDPEEANAYNIIAYCSAELGEYEKAIQAVKNYIAVLPDASNTYDSACEIYIMAGRYDDAYRVCEEALRVNPEWTNFRRLQSYIHLFRGETREALEMSRRIAEMEPSRELDLQNDLGCLYLYQGRYDEAATAFQKVVSLARDGKNAETEIEAHLIMGRFYGIAGDFSKASREFATVKNLSEKVYGGTHNTWPVRADYYAGVAAIRKGDYQRAQAAADSIRNYVSARHYDEVLMDYNCMLLAEIHLKNGRVDEASSMLGSVSAGMRHQNPHYKALAADLVALRGEIEEAIQEYIKLYHNFSDSQYAFYDHFVLRSTANYSIARLYDRMGDERRAAIYYRKTLDQWKNADPDLPELIDAKRRLSELS